MKEQRLKDSQKAKLISEFDSSINPDMTVDSSPLLQGDANEEQRLKKTMEEKKKATKDGKLDAITEEEIQKKAE
jgi:hypothetical protein